jgi:hypothetical protein
MVRSGRQALAHEFGQPMSELWGVIECQVGGGVAVDRLVGRGTPLLVGRYVAAFRMRLVGGILGLKPRQGTGCEKPLRADDALALHLRTQRPGMDFRGDPGLAAGDQSRPLSGQPAVQPDTFATLPEQGRGPHGDAAPLPPWGVG